MIFIHHHGDTEREEKPPERIRHVAKRANAQASPLLFHNNRIYVNSAEPTIDRVMSKPESCGSDFWEIVVEATDL